MMCSMPDMFLRKISFYMLCPSCTVKIIKKSIDFMQLAIIGFNNEVTIRPSGCFSANLAQATTQNVRNLTNFLGELALRFEGKLTVLLHFIRST